MVETAKYGTVHSHHPSSLDTKTEFKLSLGYEIVFGKTRLMAHVMLLGFYYNYVKLQ